MKVHFVFMTKMKLGQVAKCKARLVVGGHTYMYMQEHDMDCNKTFALVIKYTTLGTFVAIGTSMHEDIYVRPHPEMFAPPGMVQTNCVSLSTD